jgi:hypothetical protein
MKLYYFAGIILILTLIACRSGKLANNEEGFTRLHVVQENETYTDVLFAFLRIQRDPASPYSIITVKDTTRKYGVSSQKFTSASDKQNPTDCLQITVYDRQTPLHTQYMEHPLCKSVEYAEGDTFKRVRVHPDTADFFVRIPLYYTATEIKLFEMRKDVQTQEIMNIKLINQQ